MSSYHDLKRRIVLPVPTSGRRVDGYKVWTQGHRSNVPGRKPEDSVGESTTGVDVQRLEVRPYRGRGESVPKLEPLFGVRTDQ